MIQDPYEILDAFPVRKTSRQKKQFIGAIKEYAESLGYPCQVEKGSFDSRNIVIGDPRQAKHLITAHYDTCAALPFPNLITPCNLLLLIGYSLLISVLFIAVMLAVQVVTFYISDSFVVSYYTGYAVLLLLCVLTLFGPANRHNANDNTSGVITVLEIARTLPELQRKNVCFVLFDLEEAGVIGSASYAKRHKNRLQDQLVWNLDCVGDGDYLYFFPNAKMRKSGRFMQYLHSCSGVFGNKQVVIRHKGFSFFPSDQMNFPNGVGIAALHKGPLGYYLGRIHTSRDRVLQKTNVNILRAAITSSIVCNAD